MGRGGGGRTARRECCLCLVGSWWCGVRGKATTHTLTQPGRVGRKRRGRAANGRGKGNERAWHGMAGMVQPAGAGPASDKQELACAPPGGSSEMGCKLENGKGRAPANRRPRRPPCHWPCHSLAQSAALGTGTGTLELILPRCPLVARNPILPPSAAPTCAWALSTERWAAGLWLLHLRPLR